jgi:hypothetical protein
MGKSSFQSRLDRILMETAVLEPQSQDYWITPDDIWMQDSDTAVAFVYDTDNILYYIKAGTHTDLFETESNLNDFNVREDAMDLGILLGRVGYNVDGHVIISFWNKNPSDYSGSRLSNCLQALEDKVLQTFEEPSSISTPIGSYKYAEHAKDTKDIAKTATELSPEKQKEYYELLKKVHMLHGDEKKAVMKKLGLGWKTPGKHPWQKTQEKAGMLGPGQKWWAPQSESRQLRG